MDISAKDLTTKEIEINPQRGEVYRLEIIDAQGCEQKGNKEDMRLAVVVSNNQQNAKKNVIVIVPLSSKVKKIYPFLGVQDIIMHAIKFYNIILVIRLFLKIRQINLNNLSLLTQFFNFT